jgi:predicted nucleic acid-binding protein
VPAFADTSALLKLYVAEDGSRWMSETVRPDGIAISDLAVAETGVTLARLVRDGLIPAPVARSAWKLFRRQLRTFIVYGLERRSLISAANLAARSPVRLRTLDAIHLQGATEASIRARRDGQPSPVFISADARLLAAAGALGFRTDNPLNHP